MSELYLMVTISDRNFHRRLLAFYKEYGVTVTMVTPVSYTHLDVYKRQCAVCARPLPITG